MRLATQRQRQLSRFQIDAQPTPPTPKARKDEEEEDEQKEEEEKPEVGQHKGQDDDEEKAVAKDEGPTWKLHRPFEGGAHAHQQQSNATPTQDADKKSTRKGEQTVDLV